MMSYNFTGFLRGTIVKALLSALAMGVVVSGSAFAAELGLPVVTPPLPVALTGPAYMSAATLARVGKGQLSSIQARPPFSATPASV